MHTWPFGRRFWALLIILQNDAKYLDSAYLRGCAHGEAVDALLGKAVACTLPTSADLWILSIDFHPWTRLLARIELKCYECDFYKRERGGSDVRCGLGLGTLPGGAGLGTRRTLVPMHFAYICSSNKNICILGSSASRFCC